MANEIKVSELTADDIYQINRLTMFKALKEQGVEKVSVSFDGCGDSGQLDEPYATDHAGKAVSLTAALDQPLTMIISNHVWSIKTPTTIREEPCDTIAKMIEHMCYELLEKHGGWEINDGSYGEFTMDVNAQEITLEMNERYTSSNYSEHEY